MNILLSPPVAFLIYIPLVLVILGVGRILAGPGSANAVKSSTYGSGEKAPETTAIPGYKPFFLIALFFAVLHLGVLMLGSGGLSAASGVYMLGLILALLALIIG